MAKGIPENVLKLLIEADKRNGFPAGTMQAILQQETGGNAKYLQDPAAYHYAPNAEGKRIAGHTGKVSTAFGPFGILESTGSKPGYGVAPLKDKSLEEQVRFASDYLAARSKEAGSLQGGLAGYGEGTKYGQQVASRIAGKPASILAVPDDQVPTAIQTAAVAAPQAVPAEVVAEAAPVVPLRQATAATGLSYNNPWSSFRSMLPVPVMQAADLNYGNEAAMKAVATRPDFRGFNTWKPIA